METPTPQPPQQPSFDWRKTLQRARQIVIRIASIFIGTGETPLSDLRGAFGNLKPRRILAGLLLLAVAGYLLTGIYVVAPGEAGVVRRFGAVVESSVPSGLHYRLPWPIDRVDIININEIRREVVGVMEPEADHEHPEPPSRLQVLSGDTNVIDVEIIVQYQVNDPAAYLVNVQYAPYRLVRDVVRQSVTSVMSRVSVDEILTTERQSLQNAIRTETQQRLDNYNSGLLVVGINLQKTFPPDEVADAFIDVSSARDDRGRAINDANGYANSVLPQARGNAQGILADAEGYRSNSSALANGAAEAFRLLLAEYDENSQIYGEEITRYRLYLETLEIVLPRVQIYIIDTANDGSVSLRLFGNPSSASIPVETPAPGR